MGKKLLFCLLLLAGVGWVTADSLFGFTLPVGATAAVPDCVGQCEDALRLPDWVAPQTEYRYDAAHPAGTVIGQSPAAGSPWKINDRRPCDLLLTVSLGPERREVPAVAGRDGREAAALLRQAAPILVSSYQEEAPEPRRGPNRPRAACWSPGPR